MPRVHKAKKSNRGKEYHCASCPQPIVAGQEYYSWSFRYGGTRRQHVACGYPRRGQLTQSKLGAVYDAQDDAEKAVDEATDAGEIADAVRSAAEAAREVAEEYREAVQAMNMEGSGTENEERADTLEAYADEVENTADEIDGELWERAEPPEEDEEGEIVNDEGETEEEWLEGLRERAREAIGQLEL